MTPILCYDIFIQKRNYKMNKNCWSIGMRVDQFFIVCLIAVILLVSCSSKADPGIGEAFLTAINIEDFETANQYVCPDQQGEIGQDILNRTKVPPKGMDVLGLSSPGMSEINCISEGTQEISCSFWAPELQCTGNLLAGEAVSCTSWKLKGQFHDLLFTFEDGKICDFSRND
jgi:hypothetical protein